MDRFAKRKKAGKRKKKKKERCGAVDLLSLATLCLKGEEEKGPHRYWERKKGRKKEGG